MLRRSWLLVMIALLPSFPAGCSRFEAGDAGRAEVSTVLEIDRVIPVGRGQITESLDLVGTLVPWRFATVVPEVDGVIQLLPTYEKRIEVELEGKKYSQAVTLDIGHQVKQGDVLVKLDPREHELALEIARRRLELAKAERDKLLAWTRAEEVEQLRAQRDEAVAVLERAKLDRERVERLRERDVSSNSEYEAAVMAYNTAKAAVERAEAGLKLAEGAPTPEELAVAEAQVKLAEAEVALRQDALDKCTITCPFDAVITDRFVGVGDRVTATPRVEIMQIVDPSILFAQVAVPEKYQRIIEVNDLAVVQAPGVSEPVPGVVALVNEKIDPETRTFRVRVGVENKPREPGADSGERIFKSGSYVRVTLSVQSAPDVLVVPAGAMTFEEGQPAVFVFHGDRVEKRAVKLGISGGSEYEVIEGLSEGEEVVAGRTALLADGMPVRLRAGSPPPAEAGRRGPPGKEEVASGGRTRLSLAPEAGEVQP